MLDALARHFAGAPVKPANPPTWIVTAKNMPAQATEGLFPVVESYRDAAEGLMAKDAGGKLAMTQVTLHPDVQYGGDRKPTRKEEDAMHHEAHDECFIARSVKTDVGCEPVRA